MNLIRLSLHTVSLTCCNISHLGSLNITWKHQIVDQINEIKMTTDLVRKRTNLFSNCEMRQCCKRKSRICVFDLFLETRFAVHFD